MYPLDTEFQLPVALKTTSGMMTSTDYELRPATKADRAFLYHLLQSTLRPYVEQLGDWDEVYQRKQFDRRFDPKQTQVIQVEGRDAGCVMLEERAQELYLAEIQILPAYQSRGIGTSILRDLMNVSRERGLPLALQVLRNNPARRLYERLGFRRVDQSYWHYHFIWEASR